MKNIKEIATMFEVSGSAVRKWVADGLPHRYEKIIGRKTRVVIDPADVIAFHKSKERKAEKTE